MTRIIRDLPEPITEVDGDRTTVYTKEIVTYEPQGDSLVMHIARGWVAGNGNVVAGDHPETVRVDEAQQQARVRTAILQTLDDVRPRQPTERART
jgi:hypothetical protein